MKIKSFMQVMNVGKYVAMAALLMGTMTACSDDDDDNGGSSFEAPKYEAEAAKFIIDEEEVTAYKSIELTASGNFIIEPSEWVNGAPKKSHAKGKKSFMQRMASKMIAPAPMATTRYEVYSLIAYGTYTKTGENQYNLEGFGTLTIKKNSDGTTQSIILAPLGEEPQEYKAHEQNADLNSDMSNKLCRTWNIESFRYYAKINGRTFVDISANTLKELATKMLQWAQKNDPDFDEDDWGDIENEAVPEDVIFTKTGTYMVLYSNENLAVSTWKWKDERNGILRYSWDPNSFDNDDYSGDVKIEFKNNKLHLTESDSDYDEEDGETYEEAFVYIMHEKK